MIVRSNMYLYRDGSSYDPLFLKIILNLTVAMFSGKAFMAGIVSDYQGN